MVVLKYVSILKRLYASYFIVDSGGSWLTPELLSLFLFHEIRILNKTEEIQIIEQLVAISFSP